MISEAQTVVL